MSTLPVAQAQNLVLWSGDLTHFTKILLTTPSPTRMLESNDGAPVQHYFPIAHPAITAGVTCTIKIVCKSASRWLYMSHGGGLQWCYLNPITGAVGTKTAGLTITPRAVGSNWEFTIVGASNVATSSWLLFTASGDNGVSYQGNGTGYVDVFQLQRTHANRTGPYVQSAGAYVLGPIRNVAEPVPVVNKVAGLAASWTPGNGALITDEVSTRPGAPPGEMAIRVTRNGINNPTATKISLSTIGQGIMVRIWQRNSGDFLSYVMDTVNVFGSSPASTAWKQTEFVGLTKIPSCQAVFSGTSGSGWMEFVIEYVVLSTTPTRKRLISPVNKVAGLAATWTAQNSALLTDVASTRPGAPAGEMSLRITRNGVNYPCALKTGLTTAGQGVLMKGWMRTSGVYDSYIANGGAFLYFSGKASSTWQQIEQKFIAAAGGCQLVSSALTGAEWAEYAGLTFINLVETPTNAAALVPAVPTVSGTMYRRRNDGLVGLWDERGHAGDFSQWDDQSGRGNHLFQATAENRFSAGPLIKGLATMLSPDGKYMLNANRLDLRPDAGLFLVAVFRVDVANATYNHICGWGDTWPSGYGLTRVVGFGGGGWVDNASGTGTSYVALPAVGNVSVISVRYDGIVQAAKLNSSAEVPIARVGNVDYSTGPLLPNFVVGALSRLVADRYLNGVLCEVRLYADRKTAAFTSAVHTELTAKWL